MLIILISNLWAKLQYGSLYEELTEEASSLFSRKVRSQLDLRYRV